MKRLRELDFLRGLAIILVLFRHQRLFDFTSTMGWIGVDLFFVLSGYLVSGLLFKEYLRYGNIRPKNFLIRRGFKIYPIYYIFYILYLIPILHRGGFELNRFLSNPVFVRGVVSDLFFVQNYVNGWGFAYAASWSLAVEEHFYFALSLFLWLMMRNDAASSLDDQERRSWTYSFQKIILGVLVLCLFLRILTNVIWPHEIVKNANMSHLRIDSLLAGVFISFRFHFKHVQTANLFNRYKYLLLLVAFFMLSWTPFIDPYNYIFGRTVGFTMTYLSFSILLCYFIFVPGVNNQLDSLFTRPIVDMISKIGFCSYSIYIIHCFVNLMFKKVGLKYDLEASKLVSFMTTSILSIVIGMMMTYLIEAYFLRLRNKYAPNRIA